MARFIMTLIICAISAQLMFADNSRQIGRYVKEAEYYPRKADNYRREAQYYLKKAQGCERDAQLPIARKGIQIGQSIFNEKLQERWNTIGSGCAIQLMPMTEPLTICERHRIF